MQITRRNIIKTGLSTLMLTLLADSTSKASDLQKETNETMAAQAYQNGEYILPPLPYSYDSLEPLYEQKTLQLHHTKHHAGYVKGLNSTLEKLKQARLSSDFSSIKQLSRNLAFHGSGHILHTLFWHSMKPGGSEPSAEFVHELEQSFESVKAAQDQFSAAAKAVEASGWALMVFEPISRKLLILQSEKHQDLTVWSSIPILVCDVWEHAYYLQYENNRGQWVDNFMKLANWDFAAKQLELAKNIFTPK